MRGKREGTITERADGRFMVRVSLGRDAHGKSQRKTAYAKTKAEATTLLRVLGGKAETGTLKASTEQMETFFDQWYQSCAHEWSFSTRRHYKGDIKKYLKPVFGHLRLEHVTPTTVQDWINAHRALSETEQLTRAVIHAHAVLRSCLSWARDVQHLTTINAAEGIRVSNKKDTKKRSKKRIQYLTLPDAKVFLMTAKRHRLGALFTVGLASGMRLGEITGLMWDHIDLESGAVTIDQQLQRDLTGKLVLVDVKTEKSNRVLQLPPVCLDMLKRHKAQQGRERLKAGTKWDETGLVFTTYRSKPKNGRNTEGKIGRGLQPRNVLRVLHQILEEAELPRMRFHDLRHSAASLLVASGLALPKVSQILGHSGITITNDLYVHLLKETTTEHAAIMQAVLG